MFYKGEYVDSINHGVAKWNDPKWNIEWPSNNPTLQMKDK
jgi:dTDP-4-dehydrorhamnose 3,5-epimerase-like enzyme